jgi:DNA polymerase-3 subunit alpha (Gram-positive type)
MKIFVYDFETTGLNPFHDKIIDFCFYDLLTGKKVEGLVNPEREISSKITEITGITNEQLSVAEPIELHIQKLRDFFNTEETIYFVAHNGDSFDKHFLNELHKNFTLFKDKNNVYHIDTIPLSKKYIPDQYSFKLVSLCKRFGIQPGGHRAYTDTNALQKLYKHLLRIIETKSDYSYDYLLNNPNVVYDLIY